MNDLLPALLARGVAGDVSAAEQRLLAFLADRAVHYRVFVPPLPASLRYYWPDFQALLTPFDRPPEKPKKGY